MDTPAPRQPFVWQPLTPRGVAGFARASWGRLLVVQFIVALLAAGVVVWFLHARWWPVVSAAIQQLPDTGQIRSQRLEWSGTSPAALASNRFLGLVVDLKHEGSIRSAAHVQVEFGQADAKITSLLGFVLMSYPAHWTIAFNRTDLVPWWGAWSPMILALTAGGVVLALMLSWTVLAALYCAPVWLVGFFANRDLDARGSWKLAGAALIPGALFLSLALVLYGMGVLDPVRLMLAGVVHFVLGWVYCLISPLFTPRLHGAEAAKANPFAPGK